MSPLFHSFRLLCFHKFPICYIPYCSGTINKDPSYGANEDIIQSKRTKCCLWKNNSTSKKESP